MQKDDGSGAKVNSLGNVSATIERRLGDVTGNVTGTSGNALLDTIGTINGSTVTAGKDATVVAGGTQTERIHAASPFAINKRRVERRGPRSGGGVDRTSIGCRMDMTI